MHAALEPSSAFAQTSHKLYPIIHQYAGCDGTILGASIKTEHSRKKPDLDVRKNDV